MVVKAPKVAAHWPLADWPEVKTILDPIAYLYELMLPLEKVVALYSDRQPDGFDVWIVAENTTPTDREQIYDQELALMRQYPSLNFDFRLVDQALTGPADLVDLADSDLFLRLPRVSHA